jgi:hypothetical protein
MHIWQQHRPALALLLVIFLYFASGFFDSYTYWDERYSTDVGRKNYEYVSGQNKLLETYYDREYGPVFELPVFALCKALGLKEDVSDVPLRHALVSVIFCISLWWFYRLLLLCGLSRTLSTAGLALLFLSPRIAGNAAYNSKDIVMLSAMIGGAYTLARYASQPNLKHLFWNAFACGVATDVRITGIVLAAGTLPVIVKVAKGRKAVMHIFLFLAATMVVIFAFWPYLWKVPFHNFYLAFLRMQHFNFIGEVLYLGKKIPAPDLPWHYLPVWIVISQPLLHVLLTCLALPLAVWLFFSRKLTLMQQYLLYAFAVFGFFPLFYIILRHSVVYDSWRQLFFVFPFFMLPGLLAVSLAKKQGPFYALLFGLLLPLGWMIKNHPFENVFMNPLAKVFAPGPLIRNYDMDYWGIYYPMAYRPYLHRQPAPTLWFNSNAGHYNFERDSLMGLTGNAARTPCIDCNDLYISNLRWDVIHSDRRKFQPIDSVCMDKEPLVYVFRVNK